MSAIDGFLSTFAGIKPKKRESCHRHLVLLIYFVTVTIDTSFAEKRTVIELRKWEKTAFQQLTAGAQSTGTDVTAKLLGRLRKIGRENDVNGRIHMVT